MDVLFRSRVSPTLWLGLPLVLAAFFLPVGVRAHGAAAVSMANQPTAMNTFVLIFRQGPRTLTDADKQRRAEETSAWARRCNEAGHKLDPHILAPERALRGPDTSSASQGEAWPVTALLFLEAKNLAEAAEIAEAHPALRYGATVEVRPWGRPAPVATPAQPSSPAS